MKTTPEVKRLANKLSYQGKALQRRLKNATLLVEDARARERHAKREWLKAQVTLIYAEDTVTEILAVAALQSRRARNV